ncbi:Terpenoid synthase [Mycena sanguinolenta]|uniref:(2E,6E)-farnesyl diphosphate synthase n=1 Tax=Mycena sanguinolenta TaxID=230812 RepID=A0A8H6XLC0_9AGAR|nr:Terpenoid synthase [Mycena sanguinolenta]
MPLNDILSSVFNEACVTTNEEQQILGPFTYVSALPGKGIRHDLLHALNVWMNVPEDKLKIIANLVAALHNASLMLDDIEDNSKLRRGSPATHRIFGIPQTINAATYVHCATYQELYGLEGTGIEHRELSKLLTEELKSLHYGQGLDLLWRDSMQCPTEDEYIEMVKGKTGGLLRIGVRLMMARPTNDSNISFRRDYVPLINLVGVHFQIRDDFINLRSKMYSASKGFAEDMEEGKFSFPIIHAIHVDGPSRQMINVLQQRPTTPTLKTYAINHMEQKTDSFEYTLSILEGLECEIRKQIFQLGGNAALTKIIDALHIGRENQDL